MANQDNITSSLTGYAPITEGNIFYKSVGEGLPIVVLHGGPGLSHDHFLPQILPLSNSYQLVLYDQRGSGKSHKSSIKE